ncbi:PREDICTED: uncharacterized protein LOC107533552 [Miniopterus natalensis]|uniref:uncharacterized protein LOC107533552 n=1 Tax=Miniopterus natalensis TaxID=291302 RepID=UPI0007A70420|nr:PREDICTED: uncharacterized protein LOC107533552 [Miniopterus natalensis]
MRLERGGCGMMEVVHQLGFCLPQSPLGRRRAHSKPIEEPVVQPVEQKLEDPQVSGELGTEVTGRGGRKPGEILSPPEWRSELPAIDPECASLMPLDCQPHAALVTMIPLPKPPSSEPKLGLQPEPTVKFLFTLLSEVEPPEPKDPKEDLAIQESRFLDEEDWGAQQTLKEISHLQNACMRLQESLSSIQADNLALGEKLQNLPSLLYEILREEVKTVQEEGKAVQEAGLFQVDRQPHGEW